MDEKADSIPTAMPALRKFRVATRLKIGKMLPAANVNWTMDHFLLTAVPSERPEWVSEAVLQFDTEALNERLLTATVHEQFRGICDLLSLLWNTTVTHEGCRVLTHDCAHACTRTGTADSQLTDHRNTYKDFYGEVDMNAFGGMGIATSLPPEHSFQFQRAARMYAKAIPLIPNEPELALVLMVSAIECMACNNQILPPATPEESKNSRFCRFLQEYVPLTDRRMPPPDRHQERRYRQLLVVAYDNRSSFVHSGKNLCLGSRQADDAGIPYFRTFHFKRGKLERERTISLRWFAYITRTALCNYLLRNQDSSPPNWSLIREMAEIRSTYGMHVKGGRLTPLVLGEDCQLRLQDTDYNT